MPKQKIDFLVLDLMLPGEDGLSLCRRLRGTGVEIPIIMLTAKGDEVDRIVGLEMGADDYLAKPFNPRELVARINAILRRDRKPPIARRRSVMSLSASVSLSSIWARVLLQRPENCSP